MSRGSEDELVVWGIGTARTFRVHWMLEELGLPYRTEAILSRGGEIKSTAYHAVNPRAKIPALVHGALCLAESAAIVTYLAEHFGKGRFLPPHRTPERAIHDQWCFFVMTELDAHALYVVRRHEGLPHLYGEAPLAVKAARAYFQRQAAVAEEELDDERPFLLGADMSCADLLLGSCLDWGRFVGEALAPVLEAYRARLASRPAYQAAFATNFTPEAMQALRPPA